MNVEALIAYLAAWAKELIKTVIEAFDWLSINFGAAEEGATE